MEPVESGRGGEGPRARLTPNHQSCISRVMGVFSYERNENNRRARGWIEILDRDRPSGTDNHQPSAITEPRAPNHDARLSRKPRIQPPYSIIRPYYRNARPGISARDRWGRNKDVPHGARWRTAEHWTSYIYQGFAAGRRLTDQVSSLPALHAFSDLVESTSLRGFDRRFAATRKHARDIFIGARERGNVYCRTWLVIGSSGIISFGGGFFSFFEEIALLMRSWVVSFGMDVHSCSFWLLM